MANTITTILQLLNSLSPPQQLQVLHFTRTLQPPVLGIPGRNLLQFAGLISPEDLTNFETAVLETRTTDFVVPSRDRPTATEVPPPLTNK